MEKMRSGIGLKASAGIETGVIRNLQASDNQYYRSAAASQIIRGTPGDVDHRQFLTDSLAGYSNVQVGNKDSVTGSIARRVDTSHYTDIFPGVYNGFMAPRGHYAPQNYQFWTVVEDNSLKNDLNTFQNRRENLLAKFSKPSPTGVSINSSTGSLNVRVLPGRSSI